MTNGGQMVTNGKHAGAGRIRFTALALFAAVGLLFAAVNAASLVDDYARLGRQIAAWKPWTWELSSLLASLMLAPAVFWLVERTCPPRFSWPAFLAALLPASMAFSAIHVLIMIAARKAAYLALGDVYSPDGPLAGMLLYEYRKDVITFAALVLLLLLARRLLGSADRAADSSHRLEVRDGARTLRIAPCEIDWAQAAGNYVELFGNFGTLLHRRSLAALEKELAPYGFRRIHRGRIVRDDAIRAVETKASGDFDILLTGGARLAGSRRYRQRLD